MAKGFKQREGVDNFDTYAPMARITSIHVLLALASIYKLIMHQMDVKTAFLNGDLDEEVYMEQLEDFVLPRNEKKVCKLVKSLYDMRSLTQGFCRMALCTIIPTNVCIPNSQRNMESLYAFMWMICSYLVQILKVYVKLKSIYLLCLKWKI